MNIIADVPLKCRANERNQVYLIAECSRHYEKGLHAHFDTAPCIHDFRDFLVLSVVNLCFIPSFTMRV